MTPELWTLCLDCTTALEHPDSEQSNTQPVMPFTLSVDLDSATVADDQCSNCQSRHYGAFFEAYNPTN